jgi:hypothetical protein
MRLELPNADFSLPAGLRCKADLGNSLSPAQKTPTPMPTSAPKVDTSLRPPFEPALVVAARQS